MSTTAERLQSELVSLSEADRAELAHFLIQSLQPQADADVEGAWDAELERRGNQIRTGQAAGEPAEKVFSELRSKRWRTLNAERNSRENAQEAQIS